MGYERYPRGTQPGDYYNRGDDMDYGRDYGSGRDYSYSSARDYEAAGEIGGDESRGRGRAGNRGQYRDRGQYGAREQYSGNRDYYGGRQNEQGRYAQGSYGQGSYGQGTYGQGDYGSGRDTGYHGSYASDGRRFEDVGRLRHADDDNYQGRGRSYGASSSRQQQRGYGQQPEGYDYEERGFMARAGDEVRSWFGDDEAERRREMDSRYDERHDGNRGGTHRDADYSSWRSTQIAALDRDYDEYRRENQTKFHNEFSSWRSNRQGQRDALSQVEEHAEVVGSDGAHVGTVDKVRGDRILLTKNDADADGRHHSFPSNWIDKADAKKVTLSKTADEAKQAWKDEDRNSAMSGWGDNAKAGGDGDVTQGRTLNRSFSGTY